MTDKELIELAAKAAGYEYECIAHTGYPEHDQHQIRAQSGEMVNWNPLTDDGDCVRMEAAVGIGIRWRETLVSAYYCGGDILHDAFELFDCHGGDKNKARRYASTKCAAEIGRNM